MAWTTVVELDVRKRWPELEASRIPKNIIDQAITDAEAELRPIFETKWDTTVTAVSTAEIVLHLVRKLATANVYASTWGMATYRGEAGNASAQLRKEVYDYLESFLKTGSIPGAARKTTGVRSNSLLTDPVFTSGREETLAEPTDKLETTLDEEPRRD